MHRCTTLLLALLCGATLVLASGQSAMSALPTQSGAVNPSETDHAPGPRHPPVEPRDVVNHAVEWVLDVTQSVYAVGCTQAQDSLLWVSWGYSPYIGWWNILNPARPYRGSFAVPGGGGGGWGVRDMEYDPNNNAVYGGYESNQFILLNATTHASIATRTVTGATLPSVVRVMGFWPGLSTPSDSLVTGNWASPSYLLGKFDDLGGNHHTIGPYPYPLAPYGITYDANQNCWWLTDGSYGPIHKLNHPAMTEADNFIPAGWSGVAGGGCSMWRSDTFLLAVGQSSPDKVFCIRLRFSANDVGMTEIERPSFFGEFPETFGPKAQISNIGPNPQNNFWVRCTVIQGATLIYKDSVQVTTPIPGGTSTWLTFPNWTNPVQGTGYSATFTSLLPGDQNPANNNITRSNFEVNDTLQCKWDDLNPASPGNGWGWNAGYGRGWLHAFPNYWGEIKIFRTRYALYPYSTPNTFQSEIRNNAGTGGSPGAVLYNSGTISGTLGTWIDHNLPTPLTYTGSRFYVEWVQVIFPPPPYLSVDAGRNSPSWAQWSESVPGYFSNSYTILPADPGIRCFITKGAPNFTDVGVTEIIAPTGQYDTGDVVIPEATWENFDPADPVNFTAYFFIEDPTDTRVYSENIDVTGLALGADTTLQFPECTLDIEGDWLAKCSTAAVGDSFPDNDWLEEGFVVVSGNPDVGVDQILAPTGFYDTTMTITPSAEVHNYGDVPMTFDAWFVIWDTVTDQEVYREAVTVTALSVGIDTTLEWIEWVKPHPEGPYTTQCSLAVSDLDPSNDIRQGSFTVGARPPWPSGWKEVKSVSAGAFVKDGGWLAFNEGDGYVYEAKGNKSNEFYRYDAIPDTWTSLAPIKDGVEGKPPKKGCKAITDGENYLYMTKGNNTFGFWRYDIGNDSWQQYPDVPPGPKNKKCKSQTDLAYVPPSTDDSVGYVYLIKGPTVEFYKFNTATKTWSSLADAPSSTKPKYSDGSWLLWDEGSKIYAHQGKYAAMFTWDADSDKWSTTNLGGIPAGSRGKKPKHGSAGAWYDGAIYALKGGNTCEWWKYTPPGDTGPGVWAEKETMPQVGSTGKKKRVKGGGDVVHWGMGAFFAQKGNKTLEFWRYVLPLAPTAPGIIQSGVMAERGYAGAVGLRVLPNPLVGGFATVRFSVPRAGPMVVSVFDVTGRAVEQRALVAGRTGTMNLDLRNLSAGVYLVRVESDGFTATRKLVVQH